MMYWWLINQIGLLMDWLILHCSLCFFSRFLMVEMVCWWIGHLKWWSRYPRERKSVCQQFGDINSLLMAKLSQTCCDVPRKICKVRISKMAANCTPRFMTMNVVSLPRLLNKVIVLPWQNHFWLLHKHLDQVIDLASASAEAYHRR